MFGVTEPMTQTTSGSFDKTGDSIEGRQSSPQKGFSRRSPRPASRQDHEAFFLNRLINTSPTRLRCLTMINERQRIKVAGARAL